MEAVKDYSMAISLNPKFVSAYYNRGLIHLDQNNNQQVILDMNKVISLYSEGFVMKSVQLDMVYSYRADAFYSLGQYSDAILDYSKAVELDTSKYSNYLYRGRSYARMDETEKAVSDFTKVIEITPTLEYPYNERGIIYDKLGKSANAIKDYSKAISINPGNPVPYFNRGSAYKDLGKLDAALADYKQAIEQNKNYEYRLGSDFIDKINVLINELNSH